MLTYKQIRTNRDEAQSRQQEAIQQIQQIEQQKGELTSRQLQLTQQVHNLQGQIEALDEVLTGKAAPRPPNKAPTNGKVPEEALNA